MEHIRQSMLHARATSDEQAPRQQQQTVTTNSGEEAPADEGPKITIPLKREIPKVGRNDPCPCGSGKKYKACCGRNA